ncbi:MAG TPA: YbbR-like domain-containing protein [Bacteroidia bacterium]|nr:YbbR-like domain-containing protein [Bacteroidia bacterium]
MVATFLWFVKSLNASYNYTLKVPVVFKNLPLDKKPIKEIPEYLNIEINTSGLKLFFILLNQPFNTLEIDMNRIMTRTTNAAVKVSALELKNSLKFKTIIKQISPDTLYFTDKNGFKKNVPIKLNSSISCKAGYGFSKPEIIPSFVVLTGDSIELKKTDTVYTELFSEKEVSKELSKDLRLINPTGNIFMSENKVQVRYGVEKLTEHSLTASVSVINLPDGAKNAYVFPSTIKVKYTVLQNEFEESDTVLFKACIDAGKLKNNKGRVYLSTQPGNATIISLQPEVAEIILMKK